MSIIIANRTDGTGSRLISLMNAMYLAKILNKQVNLHGKIIFPLLKILILIILEKLKMIMLVF